MVQTFLNGDLAKLYSMLIYTKIQEQLTEFCVRINKEKYL